MKHAIFMDFEPDAERRNCYDCYHCQAAMTWWCMNEDARKERGTNIPGVNKCPHWKPALKFSDLSFFEKICVRLDFFSVGSYVPITVNRKETK